MHEIACKDCGEKAHEHLCVIDGRCFPCARKALQRLELENAGFMNAMHLIAAADQTLWDAVLSGLYDARSVAGDACLSIAEQVAKFDVGPLGDKAPEAAAERQVVYWSIARDEERLWHETIKDAVEYFLDDCPVAPATLTAYGFARMEPSIGSDSLEDVLEHLDEEHADADGDCTRPTKRMQVAEADFHRIVLEEYESWACEVVTTEPVDTLAWLQEHRPDWIASIEIMAKDAAPAQRS